MTKTFAGHRAVDDLDLTVATGSVHALVGPNGAGKTTALRAVLGLTSPDAGSVRLFGLEEAEVGPRARDGVAGFVDAPRFPSRLRARRALEVLARLDVPTAHDRRDGGGDRAPLCVDAALEAVDLTDRAGQRTGTFSTGLRQRLGIAAALLRGHRMLVLDEPTSGMDAASTRAVHALLRCLADEGTTVLLSSHDLGALEDLCDDVTLVAAGRAVLTGSMADLVAAAPPPVHRVGTSDDERALALADGALGDGQPRDALPGAGGPGGAEGLFVQRAQAPQGGIIVRGSIAALDAWMLGLAGEGVAVRSMAPLTGPLESLLASLTGPEAATRPGAGDPR